MFVCFSSLFIYWINMASAPKVPKLSQVEPTRVTITYPADEEPLGQRSASRTWLVKLYFNHSFS